VGSSAAGAKPSGGAGTGGARGRTARGGRRMELGFVVVGLDVLLFGLLVGYRCITKNSRKVYRIGSPPTPPHPTHTPKAPL
jgi:hypothetical protein